MVVRRGGIGKALAIVLVVLVCGAMTACGRGEAEKEAAKAKQKETQAKQPAPQPARIVHAVASDLFPPGAPVDDRAAGVQALKSLVDWISSGEDVQADALVLVGDLGLSAPATPAAPPAKTGEPPKDGTQTQPVQPDPPPPPVATADTTARAKVIADVLATGPRSVPIYVVPGGKRLAAGANLKDTLTTLQSAVAAVVKALPAGSVTLIDLSLCYVAETLDPTQCAARVPGHQVKVVGYPAFAYAGTPPDASVAVQKTWTDAFQKAVTQEEGWQTLVVAPLLTPVVDHWSVKEVRDSWFQAGNRAAAGIGIIAPSMVRQRYESGEPWTENGLTGRWFATPPLITASAGNRPIQGASVISVDPDATVDQQVFWYSAFRPGAPMRALDKKDGWFSRWVRRPFSYLWRLGDLSPLARTALFAVAFLAAFLTAVAVWQIPPPSTNLAPAPPPAAPATGGAGAAAGGAAPQPPPTTKEAMAAFTTTTFLTGNFARTVISGIGGLAIVTLILDELWTSSKPQAQGYYVVWFVFFFVMFLWLSSFIRGLIEGVRAVIVATSPAPVVGKGTGWPVFTAWVRQIGRRFWWFLVVAADTTFNVVQGRNDVKPFFLGETIVDLQLSALVTIDRVRESLTMAIEQLVKNSPMKPQLAAGDIRVSVSVLAEDEKQAFYVSKPSQNLSTQFGEKSVAWVAVMIGQARWWVDNQVYKDIELLDNTGQILAAPHPAKLMMKDYYQQRRADYEAFIVIPIPLRQRGTGVRRAGLHISFGKKAYMDVVWAKFADEPYGVPAANVPNPPPAAYPRASDILVETNAELRPLLKQSIDVIEAALRGFNEVLFWNDPRLHRRS
ncbi:MAG TPA: hypothetical protein VFO21_23285 [Vicinamibacterales bacterium]|nr:hypothetical protein [Vicinamibacterales bacterium]